MRLDEALFTAAKYCITNFVDSVFPAPLSPLCENKPTHTCTHTYAHTCIHIHTRTHTHTHTYTHTHARTHTRTHTHTRTQVLKLGQDNPHIWVRQATFLQVMWVTSQIIGKWMIQFYVFKSGTHRFRVRFRVFVNNRLSQQ